MKDWVYHGWFWSDELTTYASSMFYNMVRDHFNQKILGQNPYYNDLKMVYLSAHDSTLSGFLKAMAQIPKSAPKYASSLLVELWSDDNDANHYIKYIFNERPLKIGPTCDAEGKCPWADIEKQWTARMVSDEEVAAGCG